MLKQMDDLIAMQWVLAASLPDGQEKSELLS